MKNFDFVPYLRRSFLSLSFLIFLVCTPVYAIDYFVDFESGSDENHGEDASAPFRHAPGDPNASGNAANVQLLPGDIVYFKGGVTYKGIIIVSNSGSEIASGNAGLVKENGEFEDGTQDFLDLGVLSGDFVYVFNNTQDGKTVESIGIGKVTNVSSTVLNLSRFEGLPSQGVDVSYKIIRPITYSGHPTWGTGPAVLSGDGARDEIFHLNRQDYVRIANLTIGDLRDIPADDCSGTHAKGAIWDNSEVIGGIFEDLTISNVWSGIRLDRLRYGVIRNNTVEKFDFIGITPGEFGLAERNHLRNGLSGIRSAQSYTVIRYNTLVDLDQAATDSCGFHSDGIGPLFSPSASPGQNRYGWIYGNFISNTVMGIFLEYNNNGTRGWTIHSNILVGHQNNGGVGSSAIHLNTAPDTRVYNNIIAGLNGASGWIAAFKVINSTNVAFFNNILYSRTSVAAGIGIDETSSAHFSADGNIYFTPERSSIFKVGSTSMGWNQWRAHGFDTSSHSTFNEDPGFVTVDATDLALLDFRLLAAKASPYSLSVRTRDFDGIIRSTNQVMIGAHENDGGSSVEPPQAPSNLRVLTQ